MSFVKYKNSNNASSLLIADITASQTTILITDGDQSLFPSSYPFLLTLEHLDASENVILREIVKVVSGNQNSFTVERSAGICVQDDTATNRVQDNTAHAFYSGDKISLYWTAEQVADIQNNLEAKANQDSIANVYDSTATYSIGDIVVYKGDRYICQTAVSTPEDFDSSKWTKVNIQYSLDDQQNQIDNIEETISTLGGIMKVDVLVLGGGGGGGNCNGAYKGGGGGAGGLKIVYGLPLRGKIQNVVVGSGGSASGVAGGNGGYSKFGGIYGLGGGGGGGAGGLSVCQGQSGGNGGGAGSACGGFYIPGGEGREGGHNGATGYCIGPTGGGGGGAGGPGGEDMRAGPVFNSCKNVFGGPGVSTCFTGTWIGLGGGGDGGGAPISPTNPFNTGRCYGGGYGTTQPIANRGGGGVGGNSTSYPRQAGSSGIVIVRYPQDCSYGIACATGGTITTATINGLSYVIHTFTSNGTFCITETV